MKLSMRPTPTMMPKTIQLCLLCSSSLSAHRERLRASILEQLTIALVRRLDPHRYT
jgi:hypothetical protein